MPRSASALALLFVLAFTASTSHAQGKERSGKEVVDGVCASCHLRGEKNAPKIGDTGAWSKRASLGLTSLTEHALKGIRNMPAHGGSPSISDVEVERAIVYMVNQSGGNWIEPVGVAASTAPRSSEQVVQMQCSQCHTAGVNGAPRIGDRAAWIPRMKKGMDALVASAVHGHGPMPARGGLADLSDQEIGGAITYMFNYGVAVPKAAAPTPAKVDDPYHRRVDGTDVYLGMMPAEAIRKASAQNNALAKMHGGVPRGDGYYHLNISLTDSNTQAAISDAEVAVKVSDAIGAESKPLVVMTENNATSYGGYFRLNRGSVYSITAQIKRPGSADKVEARFDFKAR